MTEGLKRRMKKVLVVEDDADIREAIAQLLALEGYDVVLAEDGDAGLRYLQSTQVNPDVILLDLIMPNKDGYQFRKEQALDPRWSLIPVIIMTANQLPDPPVRDVAGFLRKPVSFEDLISRIRGVAG